MSTSARPLRADAERNRRRILGAAAEVFARRGLDAGLDEIARHAGVGTATVYRRFPDKAALVAALFEQRIEAFVELAERSAAAEDAWAGLVGFCEGAIEQQIADRGLREILFTDEWCSDRLLDKRQRLVPLLQRLVDRAKASGALRPDVEVTDLAVVQIMLDAAGCFGRGTAPEQWRRQLGIVLDGLRARRDAPTPLPVEPMSPIDLQLACSCPPPARQ